MAIFTAPVNRPWRHCRCWSYCDSGQRYSGSLRASICPCIRYSRRTFAGREIVPRVPVRCVFHFHYGAVARCWSSDCGRAARDGRNDSEVAAQRTYGADLLAREPDVFHKVCVLCLFHLVFFVCVVSCCCGHIVFLVVSALIMFCCCVLMSCCCALLLPMLQVIVNDDLNTAYSELVDALKSLGALPSA